MPDMHWGSQKVSGSTSRFDLLSARMFSAKVWYLIAKGKFQPHDILIFAFYSDQVMLLKALFAELPFFDGVRYNTVDSSRGDESPIVIIDCVVSGAAAGDGMGFLGAEQRRFNVAMSRAQVGRIVIGHRDMNRGGQSTSAWGVFFDEAKSRSTILDGGFLNLNLPNDTMTRRFADVSITFQQRAMKPST